MKIIDITVNWMEQYANFPSLQILVDKLPDMKKMKFEQRDTLYFSELENFVQFFSYRHPGDGYGGATFNIVLNNGENKALIGPWSSRAGVMNSAGFAPCMDVAITDNRSTYYNKNGAFYGGAILLKAVKKWMKETKNPGFVLFKEKKETGEIAWYPSLSKRKLVKFKSQKDENCNFS